MNVSETMSTENSGIEEELRWRVKAYDGDTQILRAAMSSYVGHRAPARLLEIVSRLTAWLLDLEKEDSRTVIEKIIH